MATILLIDDDPTALVLAEKILESAGHEVVTSSDPTRVPGLAARGVDAVILDILMPGLSGYDVLHGLRDDPRTGGVPILFLSALSSSEDRVRGLREGADDFLTKPFAPEELQLRVERLVARPASRLQTAACASEPRPAVASDPGTSEPQPPGVWSLEGISDDDQGVWRTVVSKVPFHIGRRPDSDLVLPAHHVSLRHARLFLRQDTSPRRGADDTLWLRDLGSTNGTLLNGDRITSDRPLSAGDVIHFADQQCLLVSGSGAQPMRTTQTMSFSGIDLHPQLFERQRELRQMLRDQRLQAVFQPVLRLADGAVVGYELLGRGELESRQVSPPELFEVAATLGLENELSTAFRTLGLEEAKALPGDPVVFVNTHPAELEDGGGLVASLEQLRSRHPGPELVLEIHEAAVAKPSALQALRSNLESLGIGLAFDDFGTGQTRLLELIDASPHYVKFDRIWIKDLHRASRKRREMVETLVGLVTELDVATVAEGVETAEEATACIDVGFELAQGYYFGRPAPAASFAASP